LGRFVECLDIGERFRSPDEATRSTARSLLLKVPTGQLIVAGRPGVGALPDVAAELASRNPLLAFMIISRLEMGTICQSGVLRRSEQAALAAAREVVVTSPATAKLIAAFMV
jgi:hypothetical protein